MNKEIAVDIQSLSKTYKLYKSHRDRLIEFIHPLRKSYHVKHHVLKDISFSVEKGEVIGIIGENGSGKSTLLKILASVVTQTSGSFTCNGRVTALLELSAGFNLELTGVENIYYLGAIQGYSKKEMAKRMKTILDFADIGEYAYQPVTSYSSGMYVRLAFSLSINIDPDILITDEALSVGDIRFQQKCYRKIRDFKEAGKTILICTHSMSAVKDFCTRALWLHEGKIREQGDPNYVTECYNAYMTSSLSVVGRNNKTDNGDTSPFDYENIPLALRNVEWFDLSKCESYGNGSMRIKYAALLRVSPIQNISTLQGGENVGIVLYITTDQQIVNPGIELIFNSPFGSPVFKISSYALGKKLILEPGKPNIVAVRFGFPTLGNGRYTISAGVILNQNDEQEHHHWVHDALIIEVFNPDEKYKMGTLLVIENVTVDKLS